MIFTGNFHSVDTDIELRDIELRDIELRDIELRQCGGIVGEDCNMSDRGRVPLLPSSDLLFGNLGAFDHCAPFGDLGHQQLL